MLNQGKIVRCSWEKFQSISHDPDILYVIKDKGQIWMGDKCIADTPKDIWSLGIVDTEVGKTVKITEVDEDGKPIAWEAVDGVEAFNRQGDWEQNDSTKPDYVKNRPFYSNRTEALNLSLEDFTFHDDGTGMGYYTYECSEPILVDFNLDNINYYISGTTNSGEAFARNKTVNAYISEDGSFHDDTNYYYLTMSRNSDNNLSIELAEFGYNQFKGALTFILYKGVLKKIPVEYMPDEIYTDIINTVDSKIDLVDSKIDIKMDANNPVGAGSFSMGRKPNTTIGFNSHAEGGNTTASGQYSHAEGYYTTASSNSSHAEGYYTKASGNEGSHAEGKNTTASSANQHAQGKYNIEDSSDTYADIIGNGTSDTARSNAATVDWSGNAWYAGDVYVGSTSGTNKDAGSKKLATEKYVDSAVSGGLPLGLTGATVGQTVKIKSVDSSGKPTAWEAIDILTEVFTINLTADPDGNITSDKTYAQIKEAYNVGKSIFANYSGSRFMLSNCSFDDNFGIVGFTSPDMSGIGYISLEYADGSSYWDYQYDNLSTTTDARSLGMYGASVGQIVKVKEVDSSGRPTAWEATTDSTPFIVEFGGSGTESDPYTSSHTYAQIMEAISAGRHVVGYSEYIFANVDSCYGAYFNLFNTQDAASFEFIDSKSMFSIIISVSDDFGVQVYGSYLDAKSYIYGGVKADDAEDTDTQPVRKGTDGKLYTSKSLGVTGASAGQLIKIKSVDGSGKPTSWESVDIPQSDWEQTDESAADYVKNKTHGYERVKDLDVEFTMGVESTISYDFGFTMGYKGTLMYSDGTFPENSERVFCRVDCADANYMGKILELNRFDIPGALITVNDTYGYGNPAFYSFDPMDDNGLPILIAKGDNDGEWIVSYYNTFSPEMGGITVQIGTNYTLSEETEVVKLPEIFIPNTIARKSDINVALGISSGASVGQLIKVKSVDSIGKPTAWEVFNASEISDSNKRDILETWTPLINENLSASNNRISYDWRATPMKKIRIQLEIPAISDSTKNYTPMVSVLTGPVGRFSAAFYTSELTCKNLNNIEFLAELSKLKRYNLGDQVYNVMRFTEYLSGITGSINNTPGIISLQSVKSASTTGNGSNNGYAIDISDTITGLIITSGDDESFPAKTKIRIWGIA